MREGFIRKTRRERGIECACERERERERESESETENERQGRVG